MATINQTVGVQSKCVGPVLALLAGAILLAAPFTTGANAQETAAKSDAFAIARGGLLYDNWAKVLGTKPPANTHPAYPASGKQKGASTWRCKECHGWDYKGKDGAYAKGSHFSGIVGISRRTGAAPAAIAKLLRDKTHAFTPDLLPDAAVNQLARFVSAGQVDMGRYIDGTSKKAKGDANRGARLYETLCASCHGLDGKTFNFGSKEKPEYVGTLANENPWEILHKIRNGQPGTAMIALLALGVQQQVDVLAYAQTLPVK